MVVKHSAYEEWRRTVKPHSFDEVNALAADRRCISCLKFLTIDDDFLWIEYCDAYTSGDEICEPAQREFLICGSCARSGALPAVYWIYRPHPIR